MTQLLVSESTVRAEFWAVIGAAGDWTPAAAPATAKLRPTRHEPDPEQPAPEPVPQEQPEQPPVEEDGAGAPDA